MRLMAWISGFLLSCYLVLSLLRYRTNYSASSYDTTSRTSLAAIYAASYVTPISYICNAVFTYTIYIHQPPATHRPRTPSSCLNDVWLIALLIGS